nr:MAG TPA: hypothetical protein [Caudoviricetes sp.]
MSSRLSCICCLFRTGEQVDPGHLTSPYAICSSF